jgi:hypothetical protein
MQQQRSVSMSYGGLARQVQHAPTRSTRQRWCGVDGETGASMAAGSAGGAAVLESPAGKPPAASTGSGGAASSRKRFSPTCCCCLCASMASGAAKITTGTDTMKHAPRPGAVSTLMLPPSAEDARPSVHLRAHKATYRDRLSALTFSEALADVEACTQTMRYKCIKLSVAQRMQHPA